MDPESIINLVTNIGFPAAISLILLKYVLQNMESQFKQLDKTVRELTRAVQNLNVELKKSSSETSKKNDLEKKKDALI